jgi:hypothetical protein
MRQARKAACTHLQSLAHVCSRVACGVNRFGFPAQATREQKWLQEQRDWLSLRSAQSLELTKTAAH